MNSGQNGENRDTFKYTIDATIQTGKQDKPEETGASSAKECQANDRDRYRSEHARLCKPLDPDQQHCADLPGSGCTRSRRGPDPVHPCNRRADLQHLRCNHQHDRRPYAFGIPVKQVNKQARTAGPNRPGLPAGLSKVLVFAILISALIIPFASATTYLSFYPVGMDPDNIQITNASGHPMGIFNTSSTLIGLPDNQTYTILVVPANTNLLGNHPDTWFDNFVNKLQQNATSIMIGAFVLALILVGLRRR